MTEQEQEKALKGLECCSSVPSKCSTCPYEPKELDTIRWNLKHNGCECSMKIQLINDLGKMLNVR